MRLPIRHSIFFHSVPPGAFGKPRQILPDSRQSRPAFRPIRRRDPSRGPQTVRDKPLRRDLWKAGPLEKHTGPSFRIPCCQASIGRYFFLFLPCLCLKRRDRRLLYPYRGLGGNCGKSQSAPDFLQTLCRSVRSALSFFQKVFHSFSRREIGFSVARGYPDVALTGDSGGDPRVFHFVFQRPVENFFSGLFQAESFPQPVEITVDKRQR